MVRKFGPSSKRTHSQLDGKFDRFQGATAKKWQDNNLQQSPNGTGCSLAALCCSLFRFVPNKISFPLLLLLLLLRLSRATGEQLSAPHSPAEQVLVSRAFVQIRFLAARKWTELVQSDRVGRPDGGQRSRARGAEIMILRRPLEAAQ